MIDRKTAQKIFSIVYLAIIVGVLAISFISGRCISTTRLLYLLANVVVEFMGWDD